MSEYKIPALPNTHVLYTEPKDGRFLPEGSLFWVEGMEMGSWHDNDKIPLRANDVEGFEYAVPVTSLGKEETPEKQIPAPPATHVIYKGPHICQYLPEGSLRWSLEEQDWICDENPLVARPEYLYAVPVTSLSKEETRSPDTVKESWEKNITPPPATHILYEGPKQWQKLPPGSLFWSTDGWEEMDIVTAIPGEHKHYAIQLNVSLPTATKLSSPVEPDILEEARALIQGDRAASYGDAKASFERIAAFWTAYKGVEITAKDVAAMMILLKVSRGVTSAKRDNWVDMIGYAALGSQIEGSEA